MGLYLCIAQVDLKRNPREMFLYDYVMNEMHAFILYDVNFIHERDIGLNFYA